MGLALAVIVGVGVPVGVATLGPGALEDLANARLRGRLSVAEARFTWPCRLEIRGVELSGEGGRPVARVARIEVRVALVATATARPTVRIAIADPWADLAFDAAGECELVRALAARDAKGGAAPPSELPPTPVVAPPASPVSATPVPVDAGILLPDIDLAVEVTRASAAIGSDPLLGPLEARLTWSGADTSGELELRSIRADEIDVDVRARSMRPGVLDLAALVCDVHRLSIDRLPLARLAPFLAQTVDLVIDAGELTLGASGRWAAGAGEGQATVRLAGLECRGPWSGGHTLRPPEVALRVRARGGGAAPVDVLATLEASELGTAGVELRLDPDAEAAPEVVAASLGVATARVELASLAAVARPWLPTDTPRLDGTLEATVQLLRTPARGSALRLEARLEPPLSGGTVPAATLSVDVGRTDPTDPLAVARATLEALGCRATGHVALGPGFVLGAGGARLEGDLGRVSRELPPALAVPRADGELEVDLRWGAAGDDGVRSARATLALAGGTIEQEAGRIGPIDLDWDQPATWAGPAGSRVVLGKGTLAGGGLALVVSGELRGLGNDGGPEGALAVVGSIDPGPATAVLGALVPVSMEGDSITVDVAVRRADGRERVELALSGADLTWRFGVTDAPGTIDDYELACAVERVGASVAIESLSVRVARAIVVATGELALPAAEGDVVRARVALSSDLEGTDVARLLAPILHGWSFDAHAAIDVAASMDEAGQRARFSIDLAHGALTCNGESVWEERELSVAAALERPSAAIDADALAGVAIALERLDVRGPSARLRARGTATPSHFVELFYAHGPLAPPVAPAAARDLVIEGAISPDAHHAAWLAGLLGRSSLAAALDLRLVHEVRGGVARTEGDVAGRAEVGREVGTWPESALAVSLRATAGRAGRELTGSVRTGAGRVALAGVTRSTEWGTAALAGDGMLDAAVLAGALSLPEAVSGALGVAVGVAAHGGRARGVVIVHGDAMRVTPAGGAPIDESLAVRAYCSLDRDGRRIAIEHVVLDGPTVAGSGRGAVAWPARGDARLEYASVVCEYHPTRAGRWLALVAPDVALVGERRQVVAIDVAGRLASDGGAFAVLRGLSGRATVDVDGLDAGGYRLVGRSRLVLDQQVLKSQHRYTLSGEEARAGLVLDLRDGAAARSRVALSVKHVMLRSEHATWLAYLNPLFYVGSAAEGKLDGCFGIDLDATYAAPLGPAWEAGGWEALDKRPLTGVVRLDVVGLNALQSPFLDRVNDVLGAVGPRLVPTFEPLSMSIRGERFYYDRVLRVELGDNALYLAGSIGFDRSVDMELVVPLVPGIVGKLPLVDRLPKPEIKIPLRGTLGGALFDWEAVLRELGERLKSFPDPRDLIPDAVNPFGSK